MNRTELEALVSEGESEQIEFKKTTGVRSDACKTICAMLNGRGGFVFFGIRNDGQIVGQEVTAASLEDVAQELRKIEPFPLLQPESIPVGDGRHVVVVSVPGGMNGPYTPRCRT